MAHQCPQLRSAAKVAVELNLQGEPLQNQLLYGADFFAKWMATRQSKRALKVRDVIKAYLITTSSIQRGAQTYAKHRETWDETTESALSTSVKPSKVRPEDIMARLLTSPQGKAFLDAAERGEFNTQAAVHLAQKFKSFGNTKTFNTALHYATTLGSHTLPDGEKTWKRIADVVRSGDTREMFCLVGERARDPKTLKPLKNSKPCPSLLPLIGASKIGFFSALLGQGVLPTYDAREIELWSGIKLPQDVRGAYKWGGQLMAVLRGLVKAEKQGVEYKWPKDFQWPETTAYGQKNAAHFLELLANPKWKKLVAKYAEYDTPPAACRVHVVEQLKQRIDELGLDINPAYKAHTAHAVHHHLWDVSEAAVADTTHSDIISGMEFAGLKSKNTRAGKKGCVPCRR